MEGNHELHVKHGTCTKDCPWRWKLSHCLGVLDMNEHIFFKCPKAQQGWMTTTIFYKAIPQDNTLVEDKSIIDIPYQVPSQNGLSIYYLSHLLEFVVSEE